MFRKDVAVIYTANEKQMKIILHTTKQVENKNAKGWLWFSCIVRVVVSKTKSKTEFKTAV